MQFTSIAFIIFLTITLLAYYLLPKKRQIGVLLLASMCFYIFAGFSYFIFLLTTIITIYIASNKIQKLSDIQVEEIKLMEEKEDRKKFKARIKQKQKKIMLNAVYINLGILAILKYTDFVIGNINSVLNVFSLNTLPFFNMILPLGISFYTFQAVAYLMDVYRGKQRAESDFYKYALFASFFPQMIQGPINRFENVSKTMFEEHKFDINNFYGGMLRMVYGFFKKLVIADRLLPVIAVLISGNSEYQGIYFLATMFLYAIALYADFTGGIDITIAVAKMFGITLAENFDKPFLSRSIVEYWRRWHMTMGAWFRDYVFYPLSVSKFMLNVSTNSRKKLGNEMGKRVPFYMSTLIVWFCTGLWHGATWNYIVWGLVNGFVILISQELDPFYKKFHEKFKNAKNNKLFIAFTVARTFSLMCLIRAFDCYSSVGLTLKMYTTIFTNFSLSQFINTGFNELGFEPITYISAIFGVCILLLVGYITRNGKSLVGVLENRNYVIKTATMFVLGFGIIIFGAYGIGYDSSQFIYNQF